MSRGIERGRWGRFKYINLQLITRGKGVRMGESEGDGLGAWTQSSRERGVWQKFVRLRIFMSPVLSAKKVDFILIITIIKIKFQVVCFSVCFMSPLMFNDSHCVSQNRRVRVKKLKTINFWKYFFFFYVEVNCFLTRMMIILLFCFASSFPWLYFYGLHFGLWNMVNTFGIIGALLKKFIITVFIINWI